MAHAKVYSQRQLESLHDLAVDFVERDFGEYTCDVFYRNKPHKYFTKCRKKGNKMKVYMKDYNGDPRSPINGEIEGLFFATHVDPKTGEPPKWSPFGSERVSIPATTLLTTESNLYFADFYCKSDNGPHYVTLVLTMPDSETDSFCEENLMSLDIDDNAFLWRDSEEVHVTSEVLVEVFYTEDIDLSHPDCTFTTVYSRGTSTANGLPKDPTCRVCNLPPATRRRHSRHQRRDPDSDEDVEDCFARLVLRH